MTAADVAYLIPAVAGALYAFDIAVFARSLARLRRGDFSQAPELIKEGEVAEHMLRLTGIAWLAIAAYLALLKANAVAGPPAGIPTQAIAVATAVLAGLTAVSGVKALAARRVSKALTKTRSENP